MDGTRWDGSSNPFLTAFPEAPQSTSNRSASLISRHEKTPRQPLAGEYGDHSSAAIQSIPWYFNTQGAPRQSSQDIHGTSEYPEQSPMRESEPYGMLQTPKSASVSTPRTYASSSSLPHAPTNTFASSSLSFPSVISSTRTMDTSSFCSPRSPSLIQPHFEGEFAAGNFLEARSAPRLRRPFIPSHGVNPFDCLYDWEEETPPRGCRSQPFSNSNLVSPSTFASPSAATSSHSNASVSSQNPSYVNGDPTYGIDGLLGDHTAPQGPISGFWTSPVTDTERPFYFELQGSQEDSYALEENRDRYTSRSSTIPTQEDAYYTPQEAQNQSHSGNPAFASLLPPNADTTTLATLLGLNPPQISPPSLQLQDTSFITTLGMPQSWVWTFGRSGVANCLGPPKPISHGEEKQPNPFDYSKRRLEEGQVYFNEEGEEEEPHFGVRMAISAEKAGCDDATVNALYSSSLPPQTRPSASNKYPYPLHLACCDKGALQHLKRGPPSPDMKLYHRPGKPRPSSTTKLTQLAPKLIMNILDYLSASDLYALKCTGDYIVGRAVGCSTCVEVFAVYPPSSARILEIASSMGVQALNDHEKMEYAATKQRLTNAAKKMGLSVRRLKFEAELTNSWLRPTTCALPSSYTSSSSLAMPFHIEMSPENEKNDSSSRPVTSAPLPIAMRSRYGLQNDDVLPPPNFNVQIAKTFTGGSFRKRITVGPFRPTLAFRYPHLQVFEVNGAHLRTFVNFRVSSFPVTLRTIRMHAYLSQVIFLKHFFDDSTLQLDDMALREVVNDVLLNDDSKWIDANLFVPKLKELTLKEAYIPNPIAFMTSMPKTLTRISGLTTALPGVLEAKMLEDLDAMFHHMPTPVKHLQMPGWGRIHFFSCFPGLCTSFDIDNHDLDAAALIQIPHLTRLRVRSICRFEAKNLQILPPHLTHFAYLDDSSWKTGKVTKRDLLFCLPRTLTHLELPRLATNEPSDFDVLPPNLKTLYLPKHPVLSPRTSLAKLPRSLEALLIENIHGSSEDFLLLLPPLLKAIHLVSHCPSFNADAWIPLISPDLVQFSHGKTFYLGSQRPMTLHVSWNGLPIPGCLISIDDTDEARPHNISDSIFWRSNK